MNNKTINHTLTILATGEAAALLIWDTDEREAAARLFLNMGYTVEEQGRALTVKP